MAQAQAVQTLDQRVDDVRALYGDSVSVDEISEVVSCILETVSGDLTREQVHLGMELRNLVEFIAHAKEEIAAIKPHQLSKREIPSAADELDAIVDATEEAASKIMDVAEEISDVAAGLKGKAAKRLEDATTAIFEASSFQDITGQRISKVVGTLQHLEQKLASLAAAIGDETIEAEEDSALDETGEVIDEQDLLQGPQLEGAGNSQDDIDAILAGFD